MKKSFFLLMTAMLLLCSAGAQAQIKLGVQGGVDLTKLTLKPKSFDASDHLGFYIGPTVKFAIPVSGLAADISALYDVQSSKIDGVKIERKYVNVPLNLRARLDMGDSFSLFGFVGPQFSFNVGDDSFSWGSAESYKSTFQLKKSLFSTNLGGGILVKHIQITVKYNIPVGRTGDLTISDVVDTTRKNLKAGAVKVESDNTWQLGVTYFF